VVGTGGSVVFVTHDLEEAIALADRVFVLSARPATLKRVYTIDLPRPRVMAEVRYHPHFIELSKRIWADLREEVSIH
jgi:NitT/TauT family transport system ATP-binding protein